MPGGVNRETVGQHDDYLAMFCNNFVSDCQTLIEKAEEKNENLIMMSNYYTDYDQTVHHLKFCLSKCESFCGQEKVKLHTFICNLLKLIIKFPYVYSQC